jgi:hypothetical protein
MAQSRKYRSFGVRRANNLSDIDNPVQALNNLLDDLPGVNSETGITFISEDLDAIRGLKDTNITKSSFTQLAQTAPRTSLVDDQGQIVLDNDGNPISVIVSPLVRLEDRFRQFRLVTESNPIFTSGMGPRAFFIPSNLLPTFNKTSKVQDQLEANLTNAAVQTSNDFWMQGEFVINDRFRVEFTNSYGGILWEGFILQDPGIASGSYSYTTSGLFHVEYDRFNDGNWTVLKSIYAKKRDVLVETSATESTTIVLQQGEAVYLSVGDFIDGNEENTVNGISGDTITLEEPITVTAGDTLTFDMSLGADTTSGEYSIPEILDRGETPQIKKRIFWWFPEVAGYEPELKYLRNRNFGSSTYNYFFFNQEPASSEASSGSIRELIQSSVTPSQELLGGTSSYRNFQSSSSTETIYVPKSALSQITKTTTNITFRENNRSVSGTFNATDLGNIIVPTDPLDFDIVIPKDIRIKDLFGFSTASSVRIVSKAWAESRTNYPAIIIDHNGLVDHFVGTSVTDVVTVDDTSRLRVGMLCITGATGTSDFIRITEIISTTEFRTSADLNITNGYVFVYANAGILDRSLDVFCVGVFGQVLAATAVSGVNTIQLISADGVENDQVVQFGDAILANTTVTDVSGTTITLSANIEDTINQDETIVFAPSGTDVNKEICVLPLDLSPPFIGVDTGLDTNGKNIRSSKSTFNVKVNSLEFRNTSVDEAIVTDQYDRKIQIVNNNLSILAKKV